MRSPFSLPPGAEPEEAAGHHPAPRRRGRGSPTNASYRLDPPPRNEERAPPLASDPARGTYRRAQNGSKRGRSDEDRSDPTARPRASGKATWSAPGAPAKGRQRRTRATGAARGAQGGTASPLDAEGGTAREPQAHTRGRWRARDVCHVRGPRPRQRREAEGGGARSSRKMPHPCLPGTANGRAGEARGPRAEREEQAHSP